MFIYHQFTLHCFGFFLMEVRLYRARFFVRTLDLINQENDQPLFFKNLIIFSATLLIVALNIILPIAFYMNDLIFGDCIVE